MCSKAGCPFYSLCCFFYVLVLLEHAPLFLTIWISTNKFMGKKIFILFSLIYKKNPLENFRIHFLLLVIFFFFFGYKYKDRISFCVAYVQNFFFEIPAKWIVQDLILYRFLSLSPSEIFCSFSLS